MQHPLRAPAFSRRRTRGFGKLTLYSRRIDRFNAVRIIEGQRVSLNIPICSDEDICISVKAETKLHDDSFSRISILVTQLHNRFTRRRCE